MTEQVNKFQAATAAQVALMNTGASTIPVDVAPSGAQAIYGTVALTLTQLATAMFAVGGTLSVTAGLTALAGGGQTGATALPSVINSVDTVASGNDSVALPLAVAGQVIFVANNAAANSMQVFGSGTDTINNVATATGVAQAAAKGAVYMCTKSAPAGKWFRVLTA